MARCKTLAHFSAIDPQGLLQTLPTVRALNGVLTLSLGDLPTARDDKSHKITHIIFPNYKPNQSPSLDQMNKPDALRKLTACISNRPQLNQQGFDDLSKKIRDTPCFELKSGALDQTISILQNL